MRSRLGTYPASARAAATVHRVNCSARRSYGDLSQVLSPATPSLGAAEWVGPIIIEHREQRCLGAMGLIYPSVFPRKAAPNVVYVLQHAPTTSVPLNPPAARGWLNV